MREQNSWELEQNSLELEQNSLELVPELEQSNWVQEQNKKVLLEIHMNQCGEQQ